MASPKAIAAIALTLIICVPIGLGYMLAVHHEDVTAYDPADTYNISDKLVNSNAPYYSEFINPLNNMELAGLNSQTYAVENVAMQYNNVSSTYSSIPTYDYEAETYNLTYTDDRAELPDTGNYWFTALTGWTIVITDLDDVYPEYTISAWQDARVDVLDGRVSIYGLTQDPYISEFDKLEVEIPGNPATMTINTLQPTGQYANTSFGWKLPTGYTQYWWSNNQVNESVTLYLEFTDDAEIGIGPDENYVGGADYLRISYDAGTNRVILNESELLGTYSKLRVTVGTNSATVAGIASWPAYNFPATVLNSKTVVFPIDPAPENFTQLNIQLNDASDADDISIRVENANVKAGTAPATYGSTLDMYGLFVQPNFMVKLNSIAIYGQEISLLDGGNVLERYIVNDAKISVNDKLINIRGIEIKNLSREDGDYDVFINNQKVATSTNPVSIYFDGTWQFRVTGQIYEPIQVDTMVWTPGEFSFDKETFAAAGMAVAGMCMIGLGVTGRANGTKAGLLLLICGGAGLVYFMII